MEKQAKTITITKDELIAGIAEATAVMVADMEKKLGGVKRFEGGLATILAVASAAPFIVNHFFPDDEPATEVTEDSKEE